MRYWAPATYPVIDLYLADSATAVLFLGCSLSTLYCSPFFPSLFLPPPSFLPLPSSPLTLFFSTPLPSLFALHPSPLPLHHSFFTLHYSPFALHPLSFTLQPSLFNLHPLFLTLHSTFHSSFFTLHPLPLTFHSLLFTLYPSPLTFDSSLFTIHSSLFSLHHPPPFTLHPSRPSPSTFHYSPLFTSHSSLCTLLEGRWHIEREPPIQLLTLSNRPYHSWSSDSRYCSWATFSTLLSCL